MAANLASKSCFCLLGFGKDPVPLPSSATGTPMYSNWRTSCLLPLLVRIAKFFGEGLVSVFSSTFSKGLTVLIQRCRLYIVSSSSLKYPGWVGLDWSTICVLYIHHAGRWFCGGLVFWRNCSSILFLHSLLRN